MSRVVGLSSSVLFDRTYPRNPVNRRISLVVLTQEAEQDAVKMDVPALAADAQAPSPAVASSAGGPIAAPFDRPINPPMATAPAPVPKR